MKIARYTPLQLAIIVYAWSKIVILIYQAFTGGLTANPVQYLERATGHHAIALLILSFLCTPMHILFKWSEPLKRSKALGLYAFMYAVIHVIIYMDVDYGLAWDSFYANVIEKPRLIVGFAAFLLLIPLAITSFDIWKIRLGKNWKRLHWLIYIIAPLAVLHYIWSKKGDILRLQGEVLEPLIYGLIVVVFLILRIPPVKKAVASFSIRSLFTRNKKGQQPGQLEDSAQ